MYAIGETNVHVRKVAARGLVAVQQRAVTYILNSSITVSVVTKVSISGWT